MKSAFLKFSNWIKNHLPTKRRLIQVYAALLFNANLKGYISGRIYTGKTKYACVPGMNCYSCPGAVGSCPLGSLQNALASSGNTAPYYVIGILALFGLILGRTICGYLCPVGLGQELLYKLHTPKLKKNKFTRILSYLKYVLLIGFVIIIPILYGQQGIAVPGFCKYVCPAGTFGGGLGLLLNPNNQDYLDMLGPIFTWKFSLLMVIMAACVFCYRAFCRFLCPLGAIYGFFNRFAFIGVHVDDDNCTDCGMCVSHCKMDIKHVGDHECINCGECISVCPTKAISWKGGKLFLRRNEVDGGTEQPVLKLSPAKNENASDNMSATPAADSSAITAISEADGKMQGETADGKMQGDTSARFTVKIDGYAGLNPMPVPTLALESAGISAPALAPDTGIPSGGSDDETPKNVQNAAFSDKSEDNAAKSDKKSEPAKKTANGGEDLTKSDKSGATATSAPSSGGGVAKLKAAARTPKFWMQCTAILLALALLVGAFVYFGLQPEVAAIKIEIGAPCPDFSLNLYKKTADGYEYSEDKFVLSEHKGEVVIINFWATWCGPCVAELPSFEQLKKNYPDIVVVAIHGECTDPKGLSPEECVANKITEEKWQYVSFAQDIVENRNCLTYQLLGGKDAWPMTLILDKEGTISFIRQGSLTYETLKAEATKLL